jgi:hypothetical protein
MDNHESTRVGTILDGRSGEFLTANGTLANGALIN